MTQNGATSGERTPEQHAAVRRRGLPVALCAAICGAGGIGLLLLRTVNSALPPSIFGVNVSFCAILMGALLLFYVRRTPGMRIAIAACLIAILAGIAGTMVFAWQTMQWRQSMEGQELGNVRAIAAAAQAYAFDNGGAYPPDLKILLQQGRLKIQQVHSPYGSEESTSKRKELAGKQVEFEKWYAGHSDYLYFGADLRIPGAATAPSGTVRQAGNLPGSIIIACGTDPIMRKWITVVYADGQATFLDLQGAETALRASNDAREKLGLPPLRPPEAIRKAEELERQK